MATITEDYVSFESAKLLKENGFTEGCNSYFISDDEIALIPVRRDFNDYGVYLSAPTLQMAMKWLREVHHIHIRLINSSDESYRYEIYPREGKNRSSCFSDRCYYETYEKAAEEAIKYCLENLI